MIREPRRLVDGGSPFERDVIASARLDVGSDQGLRRTLAAMPTPAHTPSSLGVASFMTRAAGAKWWMIILAGTTGASLVGLREAGKASHHRTQRVEANWGASTAPVAPRAPTSPEPVPVASDPVTPSAAPQIPARPGTVLQARKRSSAEPSDREPRRTIASGPTAELPAVRPAAVGPEPASHAAPVATTSSLLAEVADLSRARAALRGNPSAALAQLDAFARAYPNSSLRSESLVLRMDALLAEGRRAEAAAVARSMLSANPDSPYSPHLRDVARAVDGPIR